MLDKAVVAVRADKAGALVMSTQKKSVSRIATCICGGPDGNFTAHPTLVGKSLKDLQDKAGKPLGVGRI